MDYICSCWHQTWKNFDLECRNVAKQLMMELATLEYLKSMDSICCLKCSGLQQVNVLNNCIFSCRWRRRSQRMAIQPPLHISRFSFHSMFCHSVFEGRVSCEFSVLFPDVCCCVFRPAKGCSTHCLLVKIIWIWNPAVVTEWLRECVKFK